MSVGPLVRELARIGRNPEGGIDRTAFSPADFAARRWLAEQGRARGLTVGTDAAANLFFRAGPEDAPAVLIGSHIDSVPGAGAFDGCVGVLAGLDLLAALRDELRGARVTVEVVSWSDEEGTLLECLGSRYWQGEFRDLDAVAGPRVRRALEEAAARADDIPRAAGGESRAARAAAYVELHVEQGPVLEQEGLQVAAVTGIVGIHRTTVRFCGRPDHAGTTPRYARADAGLSAARFVDRVDEAVAGLAPAGVITAGRVELRPGAENVVPGEALVYLDHRHEDQSALDAIDAAIRQTAAAVAAVSGTTVVVTTTSRIPPVGLSPEVTAVIVAAMERLGYPPRSMPSGAGHDAQVVARRIPAGMIFMPSRGGRSHSAAEYTADADLDAGTRVLEATVRALLGRLEAAGTV
jgi:beta-ureidopropionase / N-carbamoyl-L-amino-acid hydrolase